MAFLTGNRITANGTYDVTVFPGQAYVASVTGDLSGGWLDFVWVDSAGDENYFDFSLNPGEIHTFTVPASLVRLNLYDADTPSVAIAIHPCANIAALLAEITPASIGAATAEQGSLAASAVQPSALSGYVPNSGSKTIAGATSVSGQLELTGQAATNSTSAMTRALGDARYAVPYVLRETSTTSAVSTSYVASANTVTLPAGTYVYEGFCYGYTASSTGGIQVSLTGLSSSSRNHQFSLFFGSSNAAMTNFYTTQVRTDVDAVCEAYQDASGTNKHATSNGRGWFVIGSQQTVGFQVKQRSATDASNPAILAAGMILFRKIA